MNRMKNILKIKICSFTLILLITLNDECDVNIVVSCIECCVHMILFFDILEADGAAALPIVKLFVVFCVVVNLAAAIAAVTDIAVIAVIAVAWCEVVFL
jgi:hypothetical protein